VSSSAAPVSAWPFTDGRAVRGFRLAGLGFLAWGIVGHWTTTGTDRVAGWALLVVALASGLASGGSWTIETNLPTRWRRVALLGMAVSGGAMGAFAPVGVAFPGVVGLAAGSSLALVPASAVSLLSVVSLVVARGVVGGGWGLVGTAAPIAATGLMIGINRRLLGVRAAQAHDLAIEQARAEVLGERNRVAREVHDVLAHSLGALSVELEVADALLAEGTAPDRAREAVGRARRLAVEGLDETRRAVRALRDDPVALDRALAELAATTGAALEIEGAPRDLSPDGGLALYRTAQEGITNARKHAPGAAVRVRLVFRPDHTELTVTDTGAVTAPDPPPPGSGYGLVGMKERVELAGGHMQAGPSGPGWQVQVTVPG
jgi:signal transduction histidine kinase